MIFFNVISLDDENAQTRKNHDTERIKTLYNEIVDDEEFLIKTCFRLGKKKDTDIREVPLKVVCEAKSQRRKFLQNSTKISKLANPNLKNIVISRDLTAEQRKKSKAKLQEKKDLEASGENARLRFGNVDVVEEGEESPS